MKISQDLSSTEKLLDTIRGDAPPPAASAPETRVPRPEPRGGANIKTNIKHNLCAGVHIGSSTLSLVLTGEQKQGGRKEVVKWEVIPFPDHMEFKSSRFSSFLGASLNAFLGKKKNISVWASISTNHLKLRNLIIPHVADAKIANAALWGLKKEVEVNQESEVFDYEFIEDTRINGVKKKNVVAFTGDKKNINRIQAMFSAAGVNLAGITATPFAIQNYILTGRLDTGSDPIVVVNVRRYRSEIFCLSNNGILVARSIKTGSYSLVENYLEAAVGSTGPVQADVPALLAVRTAHDSPDFEPMEGPASRLIGKIQRTGEYCSNMYLSNEPISRYYFFGETDNCPAFNTFASEMIVDRTASFTPTDNDIAAVGVKLPTDAQARNGIIPALGLALSNNDYTPNFLYTYLEKEVENRAKKLNRGIVAAGIAGLLICGGIWFYMDRIENKEVAKRTAVEKELAGFTKSVTQDVLNKRIGDARKHMAFISQYVSDYISLAVVNEICTLTPANISIVSLDADLKDKAPAKTGKKGAGKAPAKDTAHKKYLKIQGIVSAEFTSLESSLTGYVFKLGDSPLFGEIDLENKKVEQAGENSVLKFTANMEIL
ncbi:MAG: hypothetical protein HUN04_14250 [Desulfobacter sp.]|nr:MAG: hypothetical protein HUN04_14250 [Desulfobacter sp.]